MKRCLIMRGIPGSGKSTLARFLKGSDSSGVIHSTDDYFMVDGEYRFDPSKLGENHKKNFEAFCNDIEAGNPLVIVDNTNTQKWEYAAYLNMAEMHGYQVGICSMPHPSVEVAVARNTHGVPEVAIRRMLDRWEP
jgi:tRNA uridine 5-carbamoylmethylation protein Kti12